MLVPCKNVNPFFSSIILLIHYIFISGTAAQKVESSLQDQNTLLILRNKDKGTIPTTNIMEEASAQQQGAAFPAPPFYFQRYTLENINLLEKAKADPQNPETAKSVEQLSFPIFALEPPPPVKKGVCWMFGRPWPVRLRFQDLFCVA